MDCERNYNRVEITSRLSPSNSFLSTATVLIICVLLYFFLPQFIDDNQYVRSVKGGHPQMYPNITLEEAFNDFFGSPHWKSQKGTDGSNIVIFTGKCSYDGKQANVELRYKLNSDGTFDIAGGSINGQEQNLLVIAALHATPFEEYQKGGK